MTAQRVGRSAVIEELSAHDELGVTETDDISKQLNKQAIVTNEIHMIL